MSLFLFEPEMQVLTDPVCLDHSANVMCSLPGHTDHIYALDFSHDDSYLLSGSADETVMIWQMELESDN
jgi:WD40 repeat protein